MAPRILVSDISEFFVAGSSISIYRQVVIQPRYTVMPPPVERRHGKSAVDVNGPIRTGDQGHPSGFLSTVVPASESERIGGRNQVSRQPVLGDKTCS